MTIIDYRNSDRIAIAQNPHQRPKEFRRTLCVCTAGLLRSPTLAWVLSNPPYNRNARAAGSEPDMALVPVDEVLIRWADEIVFVNAQNADSIKRRFAGLLVYRDSLKVYVLDVQDSFAYRDPALLAAIPKALKLAGFPEKG